MTGEAAAAEIAAALDGLRQVLSADGYQLDWTLLPDKTVDVRIVAGEGACAECLVPSSVLTAMADQALLPTGHRVGALEMPAHSDAEH